MVHLQMQQRKGQPWSLPSQSLLSYLKGEEPGAQRPKPHSPELEPVGGSFQNSPQLYLCILCRPHLGPPRRSSLCLLPYTQEVLWADLFGRTCEDKDSLYRRSPWIQHTNLVTPLAPQTNTLGPVWGHPGGPLILLRQAGWPSSPPRIAEAAVGWPDAPPPAPLGPEPRPQADLWLALLLRLGVGIPQGF